MKLHGSKLLTIIIAVTVFFAPMAIAETQSSQCRPTVSTNRDDAPAATEPCCPCCSPKKTPDRKTCAEFEGLCVSQSNPAAIASSEHRVHEAGQHVALAAPPHDLLLLLHAKMSLGVSPPVHNDGTATVVSLC
jgi:hypothetical protein